MLSYSQDLTINYTLNFNCRINAAISVCTLIYCRIYTQNNVKLLGVNEHLRKMIVGLVESLLNSCRSQDHRFKQIYFSRSYFNVSPLCQESGRKPKLMIAQRLGC